MGHEKDTPGLEDLEQQVREALNHLYDPTYEPSQLFKSALGSGAQTIGGHRSAVIQAIESLRPTTDVPAGARAWRMFELLNLRYIQNLGQDETAERLGITPRHLRREQQLAIQLFARCLWSQARRDGAGRLDVAPADRPQARDDGTTARLAQIQEELNSLRKSDPNGISSLAEAVAYVIGLEAPLAALLGVRLKAGSIGTELTVAAHPSALRQVLIAGLEEVARHAPAGAEITVAAESISENVRIAFLASAIAGPDPAIGELVDDITAALGGSAEYGVAEGHGRLEIVLPAVGKTIVLVIDDNEDLVHFYRRYTTNTRYRIVEAAEGRTALQAIEETRPHLVVLDIMLPDMDGYQVLTQLRQHAIGRSLPIVVCSVIGREELALALGATLYVPKPVTRQQFVDALDRAWNQPRATAPRARASSSQSDR